MQKKYLKLLRAAQNLQLARGQQVPLEIKLEKQLRRLLANRKVNRHCPMIHIEHVHLCILQDGDSSQVLDPSNMRQHADEVILNYVDRLMPMVRKELVDKHRQLWKGILRLQPVRMQVYNKGKQQGTTFNRNLVAQIIHQIAPQIYLPTANTVVMAEHLEPGKGVAHPIRQKLGEVPENGIKKSVDEYLKKYF